MHIFTNTILTEKVSVVNREGEVYLKAGEKQDREVIYVAFRGENV